MNTRTLQHAGHTIIWQLRRSARRSIGLKIDENGLTITLPARLSIAAAEEAIRKKIDWIVSRLAARPQAPSLAHGATLLWQGENLTVQANAAKTQLAGETLLLSAADEPAQLARAFSQLCRQHAQKYFPSRMAHWSAHMKLHPEKLALSSARTRWGSCSASGAIRLNWRLMQAPPWIIDYVIIHELAHLAEHNHSARFWTLVANYCPQWKTARLWLKQHGPILMGW